jgi:predicted phage terminase large subunit-like protein
LSFDGEVRSDFVAALHVGTLGAKRYIIDSVHAKLDFTQTIVAIQSFRAKYPQTSGVFIENRANGAAAISTLERQIPGINKVSPSKSKYDRAFASSDELNAGNWYLPHPQLASWVDAFLFELSAFPRGKHDDLMIGWTLGRRHGRR